VKQGQASITAQRVAAVRLTFEREPAPYGNPAEDERLARDVAGDVSVRGDTTTGMVRYLAARTTFFDRVIVRALDGGIRQVVVAAAGYDGRALRYAKPGVAWFELDHPATQRDKRERLARLQIDVDHIAFAAADFGVDDVVAAISAAGLDRSIPSLFLCEGVAVYLDRPVLESLLRGLRTVAARGSRLAISLSVDTGAPGLDDRRRAFRTAVAAMGEPARTVLTPDDADSLFVSTGWHAPETTNERARRAGLVVVQAA
jgi:methyltransferase (TIGR00027 family)